MKVKQWQVATFRHANVGGEMLVLHADETGVTFATGPTPWGTGSWGPFPTECISSVRDLRSDDSWPVYGCYGKSWTAHDLASSMERYMGRYGGFPMRNRANSLRDAIGKSQNKS